MHRLLRLRHGVLRREQHRYRGRGGGGRPGPAPPDSRPTPERGGRKRAVGKRCTSCVQPPRGAKNGPRLEDRTVRDGEIVPACAQACPSEAIVFGDLHDRRSRVSELAQDPRGYHVLAGLNTKPAITYLAKVVHDG